MATLSNNALTLTDWAKRADPEGKGVAIIAELLSQTNEILPDAVFMEGNLPTGHRSTIRTGLPTAYWRSINAGVPPSKSTTATVDDACGMLEAYSRVDSDLLALNGGSAEFRLSEDSAFLALIYGNPATDNRQYLGLAPRYGSLSAGNGQNILDAGGTGTDNTSVWLVVWGDRTVFCPFPKGSQAGLVQKDNGELTVYDSQNNPYQAFQTHYQWKNGLVVKDWRYVVRIANIKTADLVSQSGTQASTATTLLLKLMARALYRIPNMSMGKPAFYMNRTAHSGLTTAALDKTQNVLAIKEGLSQFGTPDSWLEFLGVPLRKVDQILNTEARVV
jgi:hypothetical protein